MNLDDFPSYDDSIPIDIWKSLRKRDIKKAINAESKMLTYTDEHGKPLYVLTSSGNLRRTKQLSKSTRAAVIQRDGSACVWCGSTGPFEVDHITRYVDGGSNEQSNLQTLCEPCHRSKGGQA